MAIVTPTDRPKSVRNRSVIEVFGGVFVLSCCFLDFPVGVGAFVIGLSQISSFFSINVYNIFNFAEDLFDTIETSGFDHVTALQILLSHLQQASANRVAELP